MPKPENSTNPNSRTVCRFPPRYAFLPLIPAVWGFGLWLLRSQGFIGAKASLAPLCRALWHRALVLRLETHVLTTAVCKSTRIRLVPNSCDSYAGFLWHRASCFFMQHRKMFPLTLFGRHDWFGTRRFAGGRVVQEWGWRTSRGMFCVVFMWFLRGCGAGLGARGSRVFVSFFIYFICSPSNNFLFFYSV